MSEIRKATEFTVVRSRWTRGELGARLLRESDGCMCCMGFYALACGFTEEQIRGRSALGAISGGKFVIDATSIESEVVDARVGEGFDRCNIYSLNDDRCLTECEREAKLTEVLASRGVTVKFVD